jgi:HPr Serine kinase C-terminal domain
VTGKEELQPTRVQMLTIDQIQTACARSEPLTLGDPMLARVAMPLQATFYPFGFPLEIATNSAEILAGATVCWQGFEQMFDTKPIQFRVGVRDTGSAECPPTPVSRFQQHLSSLTADGENFAISDVSKGFSVIWLNRAALAHRGYYRYFFLEAPAMCQICTSHTTPIHAACVEKEGCGILLCGDSGAGKSTLAYACARAGWTYITDDASFLVNSRDDRLVVGNCNLFRFRPSAESIFPELKGQPTMRRAEIGKPTIELSTLPLQNINLSHTSHINYVVFLNRRGTRRQELVPFPAQVAKYSIMQGIYGLPDTVSAQCTMVDKVVDGRTLELCYSNLDWAVERLERLAELGH